MMQTIRDTVATGAAESPESTTSMAAAPVSSPGSSPSVRPGSSAGHPASQRPASGGSVRDVTSSRASVPPSEPRASRTSFSQIDIGADRPARLQMIVAMVLGLVLVAIPLYLWRRPRAESIASTGAADAGAPGPAVEAPPPAAEGKPTLGDPRVLQCQDPGPKRTAADACDHVAELEKALGQAIDDAASCVPRDAGGGTIQYVADVSFKKKSIGLTTPRESRTMKSAKVAAACQSAVKSKLGSVSLDAMPHAHQRYKIAITATYPGTVK